MSDWENFHSKPLPGILSASKNGFMEAALQDSMRKLDDEERLAIQQLLNDLPVAVSPRVSYLEESRNHSFRAAEINRGEAQGIRSATDVLSAYLLEIAGLNTQSPNPNQLPLF